MSVGAIGKLFLVAALGFTFVRRGLLSDESMTGLTRLMLDVIVPCALSISMIKGFDGEALAAAAPMILAPALFIPAAALSLLLFFRLTGKVGNAERSCAAMGAIPNSFYVPFPLALAIAPPDQQAFVGVLVGAAVLAVNPLQWTLGSFLVMGRRDEPRSWQESFRHIANGPVIGIVGGFVLAQVPGMQEAALEQPGSFPPLVVLLSAADMVGMAMAPLAMIIIGGLIARCEIKAAVRLRLLLPVLLMRFVVVPGIVYVAIRFGWLPAGGLVAFALLLEAASPPAMNLTLVARRYDGDWQLISAMQLIANLVAVAVLPFWMSVGLKL